MPVMKPHIEAAIELLEFERSLINMTIATLERLAGHRERAPILAIVRRETEAPKDEQNPRT